MGDYETKDIFPIEQKLKHIINHYGVNAQQRQFAEEVFELQEAITKAENEEYSYLGSISESHQKNIAEEIADCMVMLKQFKEYYNITDEQLNEQIEYKINRQIERICKEE